MPRKLCVRVAGWLGARAFLALVLTLVACSAAFSQTQIPCPVHSPYPDVPTSLDDGYNGTNGCEIEGPGGATVDLGQTFTNYTVGELVIESGIPLTNSGTIVNDGTIINGGTIANAGSLTNFGTVTNDSLIGIDAGGTLLNENAINNFDRISVGGTLDNESNLTNENGGTLQIDFGGTLTGSGTINNDLSATILLFGTITNSGGTLSSAGTITNSGGTLNNAGTLNNLFGTINNAGTFNNNNYSTFNNYGTLTNYYGATFANDSLGNVINYSTITNAGALNNGGTITNYGTINNDGTLSTGFSSLITNNSGAMILNGSGATLSLSGTINNAGTITNYGTIDNANGFLHIQTGGVLNNLAGSTLNQEGDLIVDGTLNSVPTVQIQGGFLSGAGTINANVNNSGGTVAPSPYLGTTFLATPGTLTINGNYTQGSGGTLLIELGGAAPGDFSVLDLSGLAMLDGAVDFTTVDGFTPVAGDDFTFLLFGSYSGDFTSIDFTNWACPVDDTCTDVFDADSLTLEINGPTTSTPEPSSLPLLGMGLLAVLICSRWKRAATIA